MKKRTTPKQSSNTLTSNFWNTCRPWVAAALVTGGMLQLAAPVLAEGTAAGTSISNTATGTYDDGSGTTINTTSNTVNITVAEVAGIDVSPSNTPGSAAAGGTLNYDFTVTNTGNDATTFVLPGTATLDGTGAATVTSVIYAGPNGTFGDTDDVTLTNPYTTGSIAVNGTAKVRVVVTVGAGATSGQTIIVKYGDSIDDTNTGTNQNNVGDENGNNDVKTKDPTPATTDDPVNGVREDSATLEAQVSGAADILNGTKDHPDATGPAITGQTATNNTDFTNKSTAVPAGIAPGTTTLPNGTTYDPAPVTFTNTISNTGTASGTFTVQPTTATGILEASGKLPVGTTVKITDSTNAGNTATYSWNGSTFQLTGTTPVIITVAQGLIANYTVEVDLPAGTKLSTDLATAGDITTAYGGYSVPIAAYIDANNDKIVDAGETQNLTTDRIYTGFLSLLKESRVLPGTGPAVTGADGNFSITPKTPAPGNIVEYQITYKNISEVAPSGGQHNVILNASTSSNTKGPIITEDGTAGGNTWAKTDANGTWVTSNVPSTASDSGGTITFFSGTNSASTTTTGTSVTTDVTKYVDTVNLPLGPQVSGTFTIQRKLN